MLRPRVVLWGILLISLFPAAASGFPTISELHQDDPLFRQISDDIEQAYRRDTPRPPLLLYTYSPRSGDTLFSIAARLLLPYSTIASINGISRAEAPIGTQPLLIPNQPGRFSHEPLSAPPESPDLPEAVEIQLDSDPHSGGYFYPGLDFSPHERRAFYQRRFGYPVAVPRITSGYGMRVSPITGRRMMHFGTDFGGYSAAEVLAAADGTVTAIDWSPVLGFYIEIQHDEEISSLYGHLSQIAVNYGEAVRKADPIGRMGTTGLTTGPHVHFEVHEDGVPVDPLRHLPHMKTE